jgi:DNA-binding NtrC family response regulator
LTEKVLSPVAGRRILIVEDETLIAMEMEDLLEGEGAIIVGTANSVASGREILARTRPEAVLLDLNLAGEISAPLAASFTEQRVPFVILTGYGGSWNDHPEFRHAPRLEKPVNYKSLLRLLGKLLSVSK